MAVLLHVLLGAVDHRRDKFRILTGAKDLPMNDHLVLRINHCLAVISLNRPMGGGHDGRLVVRDVALDLLALLPHDLSSSFSLEPGFYSLRLLRELLDLLLAGAPG